MTAGNVIVTFSPVSGVASYQVKYRQTGTSTWIILPTEPTLSPFNIPVSDNSVGYDISMASNCGNGTYSTPYTFSCTPVTTYTFTVNAMSPTPVPGVSIYYKINTGSWILLVAPLELTSTYQLIGTVNGLNYGDVVYVAVGGASPAGMTFGTNTSNSGTAVTGYCGQTNTPGIVAGVMANTIWLGINGGVSC